MGILIGAFLILPIPQLAIVVFFFKSGGSGHFGQRVTTVNVFLVMHYLTRVFLIYRFGNYL
ncbi:unnamed protein product [Prunus armeniaca]|nr:unnamed protein product [Prunus armeniaca]